MHHIRILLLAVFLFFAGCHYQDELIDAVRNEDLEAVQALIDKGANPFRPDENGDSAVSLALQDSSSTELREWAQLQAMRGSREARHLFQKIVSGELNDAELRLKLSKYPFYIDTPLDFDGYTLLTKLALLEGREPYFKPLVDFHANPDHRLSSGFTPLMSSVFHGQPEVVQRLINLAADLEAKTDSGWTALHLASNPATKGNRTRDVELVKILVEAGANVEARQNGGETALSLAVLNQRPDVAWVLLAGGANPNGLTGKGGRLLSSAVLLGPEMVHILIEAGADVDLAADNDPSPLLTAVRGGHVENVILLLLAGADVTVEAEHGWTALHYIADSSQPSDQFSDVQLARALVQSGAPVNVQIENGMTPLYLAVNKQRVDVTAVLLEAGADPNIPTVTGWTPLHSAVFGGHPELTQALIHAGADVQATTDQGWTALHLASAHPESGNRRQDVQLAQMLLEAGADVNAETYNGFLPATLAATHGRSEVLSVLLPVTGLETRDGFHLTPLLAAVLNGQLDVVNFLLDAGADPSARAEGGHTALHLLAESAGSTSRANDGELARLLIDAGVGLDVPDNQGATPLYTAVSRQNSDVRDVLLESGANPDASFDGWTPLQVAAHALDVDAVASLLDAGAPVDSVNSRGWTAVHVAVRSPEPDERFARVLELLVQAGANLDHQDTGLRTPLFVAAMRSDEARLNLLLDAGAALDIPDELHWPPLFMSAFNVDLPSVRRLLAEGASPHMQGRLGQGALHLMASKVAADVEGSLEIATMLLETGVDVDELDRSQYTPLMYAAKNNNQGLVELLLEAGADPSVRGYENLTAEQIALKSGHNETAKLLKDAMRSTGLIGIRR